MGEDAPARRGAGRMGLKTTRKWCQDEADKDGSDVTLEVPNIPFFGLHATCGNVESSLTAPQCMKKEQHTSAEHLQAHSYNLSVYPGTYLVAQPFQERRVRSQTRLHAPLDHLPDLRKRLLEGASARRPSEEERVVVLARLNSGRYHV